MINDPKCRMGRSQGEREALADVQLRAQIEGIEELSAKAEDLEILMIVIKSKRTDLKDIQGRMRDQMKLIEHDLGMGARWGKSPVPAAIDDSVTEINSLLTDALGEHADLEEDDEDEEETVEEETVEEVVVEDDHNDPSPTVGTVLEFSSSDLDKEEPEPEPLPSFEDPSIFGLKEIFGQEPEPEPEPEPAAEVEEGSDDPSYDEDPGEVIIPSDDAEGDLPEADVTAADADEFLDSFDPAPPEPDAPEHPDEGSIEDLISSLADD